MSVDKLKAGFGDVSRIPGAEKIIAAGAYEGLPKSTIVQYLQHVAETNGVQQVGTEDPEPPQLTA